MESSEKTEYDNILLNILQREGKIDSFINVFFGFILRNTDFFRIMRDPTAEFGFPPGVARSRIFDAFKNFEDKAFQIYPDEKKIVQDVLRNAKAAKKSSGNVSAQPGCSNHSDVSPAATTSSSSAVTSASTASSALLRDIASSTDNRSNSQYSPPPCNDDEYGEYDGQSEVMPSTTRFQSNPDSYNGAVRDNYSWSQSIKDIDLRVQIDESIKKGKQLRVDIKEDYIKVVAIKGGAFDTVIEKKLTWKVHPTNSIWTMVPGDHVHISLEKIRERWWEACFQDEPQIELKDIDCTRPLEELDDESLATVNKLKFDQRQKELGEPTSDQMKVMDHLKTGWDSEGSPFKGQPFDPSILNI